jgi:hypothetical protein
MLVEATTAIAATRDLDLAKVSLSMFPTNLNYRVLACAAAT